jgi:MFS transporter, MCT family, solute carrier family 16 (monocarboxylic acid transporters), member 10
VLGRLLPNFFADKFGPYNMLLPCMYISAALAFAWFGISNFAGVIIFGLLYGFWSGSCESKANHHLSVCIESSIYSDVSLIPSLLAQLSSHTGEHG